MTLYPCLPVSIGIFHYSVLLLEIGILCEAFRCHRRPLLRSFFPQPAGVISPRSQEDASRCAPRKAPFFFSHCRGVCGSFSPPFIAALHPRILFTKKVSWMFLLCGSGWNCSGRRRRSTCEVEKRKTSWEAINIDNEL